jgi:hypothetical protein
MTPTVGASGEQSVRDSDNNCLIALLDFTPFSLLYVYYNKLC